MTVSPVPALPVVCCSARSQTRVVALKTLESPSAGNILWSMDKCYIPFMKFHMRIAHVSLAVLQLTTRPDIGRAEICRPAKQQAMACVRPGQRQHVGKCSTETVLAVLPDFEVLKPFSQKTSGIASTTCSSSTCLTTLFNNEMHVIASWCTAAVRC